MEYFSCKGSGEPWRSGSQDLATGAVDPVCPACRKTFAELGARRPVRQPVRAAWRGTVPAHGPDPARGEYLNSDTGQIRVCGACKPGCRVTRHTCGLAGLQAMFPLGR